jgi:hypothetical protein
MLGFKVLTQINANRWRDGMGNQNKNALPACQLTRIQGFMTKLYSTDGDGVRNAGRGQNLERVIRRI